MPLSNSNFVSKRSFKSSQGRRMSSSTNATNGMWSHKADIFRVSILFLILSFCGYTSLRKFVLVPFTESLDRSKSAKLKATEIRESSLTLCDGAKSDNLKEKCRQIVESANVEEKCAGFLKQLKACQDAQSGGGCGIAKSNYEGCAHSVVKSALLDNNIDLGNGNN